MLNFLFCFLSLNKKNLVVCFFCWTCLTFIFLVLSCFFCVLKNGSVFAFFACLLWCIWNFLFSSNKLGKTSPAFSLSAMLLSFSVPSFFSHKGVWHNPFKIWTVFWNSLFVLFLPSLFLSRKNQLQKKLSLFFQSFFVSLFSFQNFSIIIFLWSFFLSSFCSSLFCFLLLFLFFPSPFFLYFSISVFLFFSLPHVSLSVLLHLLFCVSPFLYKTFFFLSFDLDLFVFLLLLYPFFFISVSAFFLFWKNKVQYFLWSIFWKDENVFSNSPLSDFFLVFFLLPVVIVLVCPMFSFFSRFFNVSYLDFLLPIFFLCFFKNRFVSKSKSRWFLSHCCSFWKTLFPDFSTFRYKNRLPCMIFKNCFAICLCFRALFETIFFIPLFLFKKNASKKELILFTFSLYFFFFLFRSLFVCLLVMFCSMISPMFTNFFYYPVVTRWKKSCFF